MRTLVAVLAIAAGLLVAAPAAPAVRADTPLFATSGGVSGLVHGDTRYILSYSRGNTTLTAISTGGAERQLTFTGDWYFPNTPGGAEGLSHDGRTLLLVDALVKSHVRESTLIVVDPIRMKSLRSFKPYAATCSDTPCGRSDTAFILTDGLSPDGSRLYAVDYRRSGLADPCLLEHGIDLSTQQSVSIRSDGRREPLEGTAEGRAWSADGRWAYTLYGQPSGPSFIQVLDTVGAAVRCISLPGNRGVDTGLTLAEHERTLVVSRSGSPSLDIALSSYRISLHPADPFPWLWLVAGIGGLALLSAAGASVLRRRRRDGLE